MAQKAASELMAEGGSAAKFEALRPKLEGRYGQLGRVQTAAGDCQDVFMLPELGLTYRFPRKSENLAMMTAIREGTLFGAFVLGDIPDDKRPPGIVVPRLIDIGYETPHGPVSYVCVSYTEGQTLSEQYIAEHFSPEEKAHLGRAVAEFIVWFADVLPTYKTWASVAEGNEAPRMPLHMEILDRVAAVYSASMRPENWLDTQRFPTLIDVATRLGVELHAGHMQYQDGRFGHYDLSAVNMLFMRTAEGKWRLNAIIDYDFARPSNEALEMRYLPRLGRHAVRAAMEHYYELTGQVADDEAVDVYARAQSVGSALIGLRYYGKIAPITRRWLRRQYPKHNWNELEL